MKPYYQDDAVTIYHGDCRDILPTLEPVDLVLTDPPYEGYEEYPWSFVSLDNLLPTVRSFIFWKGTVFPLSYTARHIWAKANRNIGNRGEQYEEIYECNGGEVGLVMRHAVIDSDMNATLNGDVFLNHPTQKPIRLIRRLLQCAPAAAVILDPFMGSGTTLRAAKDLGRRAIGIEIEERYCEIAAKRMAQSVMPLELQEVTSE